MKVSAIQQRSVREQSGSKIPPNKQHPLTKKQICSKGSLLSHLNVLSHSKSRLGEFGSSVSHQLMRLITQVFNHTGSCLDQGPQTQPGRKVTKGVEEFGFLFVFSDTFPT